MPQACYSEGSGLWYDAVRRTSEHCHYAVQAARTETDGQQKCSESIGTVTLIRVRAKRSVYKPQRELIDLLHSLQFVLFALTQSSVSHRDLHINTSETQVRIMY